ncbi:MAG: hypothetical protein U9O55_00990 [Patescibacteria group bacterium]|nr:hypothetical protein [Patescibacteria group bacterium]
MDFELNSFIDIVEAKISTSIPIKVEKSSSLEAREGSRRLN